MMRDYDPSIGRYVESDPIGLLPTRKPTPTTPLNHVYAYARANSLSRIDPLGLVDWSGTFSGGTVGSIRTAGFYYFDLKTQCINKKRGFAKGFAIGVGFGWGIDVSFTLSAQEFKDFEVIPNPNVFVGGFVFGQGGVALCSRNAGCAGISYTGVLVLGDAYAEAGLSASKGLDFGVNFIGGHSILLDGKVEDCCE